MRVLFFFPCAPANGMTASHMKDHTSLNQAARFMIWGYSQSRTYSKRNSKSPDLDIGSTESILKQIRLRERMNSSKWDCWVTFVTQNKKLACLLFSKVKEIPVVLSKDSYLHTSKCFFFPDHICKHHFLVHLVAQVQHCLVIVFIFDKALFFPFLLFSRKLSSYANKTSIY